MRWGGWICLFLTFLEKSAASTQDCGLLIKRRTSCPGVMMRSLRTLPAPIVLMARSQSSSSTTLLVSCPPLTVPRAKPMISASPNEPSFRVSTKLEYRLQDVRSAARFNRPGNRKVAKELSSRGMMIVAASAEEWKARLGVWIQISFYG